jgi:aspartate racemase
MQGPVYPGAFGRRRLGWEIPDGADRKILHEIIFEELCLGIFTDASRAAYVTIIEKLAERGCDAVALVCTEIPLLHGTPRPPAALRSWQRSGNGKSRPRATSDSDRRFNP